VSRTIIWISLAAYLFPILAGLLKGELNDRFTKGCFAFIAFCAATDVTGSLMAIHFHQSNALLFNIQSIVEFAVLALLLSWQSGRVGIFLQRFVIPLGVAAQIASQTRVGWFNADITAGMIYSFVLVVLAIVVLMNLSSDFLLPLWKRKPFWLASAVLWFFAVFGSWYGINAIMNLNETSTVASSSGYYFFKTLHHWNNLVYHILFGFIFLCPPIPE